MGKQRLSQTSNISIETLKAEIATLNENGANLSIDPTYTYEINETVAAGNIVRISNLSSLTVGTKLSLVISEGENILLKDYTNEDSSLDVTWSEIVSDPSAYDEIDINHLCDANSGVVCKITYQYSDTVDNAHIISIARSDGKTLVSETYIKQSVSINIVICDKYS